MPGQPRPGSRSRGSWTPRIAGLAAIVLIAGGGVAVYVVRFHPSDHRQPAPFPTELQSSQTVGLVAESAVAAKAGSSGGLVQMLETGGVPDFTPLAPAAASGQGSPQWAANLMAGNGYIFILGGNCLTAESRARLVMQHCDSGSAQRWRQVSSHPLVKDGHDFYQYANVADGKCLSQVAAAAGAQEAASLATCQPGQPQSQMIAFWWSTQ